MFKNFFLHVAEVLGTHVALKGPLAGVNTLVAPQCGGKCKHLLALPTRKGFVPGVNPQVLDQCALLKETLAAELTLVRLDTGMDFGMVLEAVQPIAALSAHLTPIGRLCLHHHHRH